VRAPHCASSRALAPTPPHNALLPSPPRLHRRATSLRVRSGREDAKPSKRVSLTLALRSAQATFSTFSLASFSIITTCVRRRARLSNEKFTESQTRKLFCSMVGPSRCKRSVALAEHAAHARAALAQSRSSSEATGGFGNGSTGSGGHSQVRSGLLFSLPVSSSSRAHPSCVACRLFANMLLTHAVVPIVTPLAPREGDCKLGRRPRRRRTGARRSAAAKCSPLCARARCCVRRSKCGLTGRLTSTART
jgi:hypothetical protein